MTNKNNKTKQNLKWFKALKELYRSKNEFVLCSIAVVIFAVLVCIRSVLELSTIMTILSVASLQMFSLFVSLWGWFGSLTVVKYLLTDLLRKTKESLFGIKTRLPVIYRTQQHYYLSSSAIVLWTVSCLMFVVSLYTENLYYIFTSLILYRLICLACANIFVTGTGLANLVCRVLGNSRLLSVMLFGDLAVLSIRPITRKPKEGQEIIIKSFNLASKSKGCAMRSPLYRLHDAICVGDMNRAKLEEAALTKALGPVKKATEYTVPTFKQYKEILEPLRAETSKKLNANIPMIVRGILENSKSLQMGLLNSSDCHKQLDVFAGEVHELINAFPSVVKQLSEAALKTVDKDQDAHSGEMLGKTAAVFTLAQLYDNSLNVGRKIFGPITGRVDVNAQIGDVALVNRKHLKFNQLECGQAKLMTSAKLSDALSSMSSSINATFQIFVHWDYDSFVAKNLNYILTSEYGMRNLFIPTFVVSPRVLESLTVEVIIDLETKYNNGSSLSKMKKVTNFIKDMDYEKASKNKQLVKPKPELILVDCFGNKIGKI